MDYWYFHDKSDDELRKRIWKDIEEMMDDKLFDDLADEMLNW